MLVVLGVLVLPVVATPPSASAQHYRLAWHDKQTGVTQHDKYWTDDIISLFKREIAINFQPGTRAWIEKRRRIFGFIPWRATRKIDDTGPKTTRETPPSLPAPYL